MFVILMAMSFGLYSIFRIAAPGVVSSVGRDGERQRGIAQAISLLVLGGGAWLIFRSHWTNGMRLAGGAGPATPPTVATAVE